MPSPECCPADPPRCGVGPRLVRSSVARELVVLHCSSEAIRPKLAANLSYLFQELPFLDRFGAAAPAAFRGVECLVPYHAPPAPVPAPLHRPRLLPLPLHPPPPH